MGSPRDAHKSGDNRSLGAFPSLGGWPARSLRTARPLEAAWARSAARGPRPSWRSPCAARAPRRRPGLPALKPIWCGVFRLSRKPPLGEHQQPPRLRANQVSAPRIHGGPADKRPPPTVTRNKRCCGIPSHQGGDTSGKKGTRRPKFSARLCPHKKHALLCDAPRRSRPASINAKSPPASAGKRAP